MNTIFIILGSQFELVGRRGATLGIACLALFCIPSGRAADQADSGREGGLLVKDFQKLKEQVDQERASIKTVTDNPHMSTARQNLNLAEGALASGDDRKACEIYAAEMKAGHGPDFWRAQRKEADSKEQELLALYDRLVSFWHMAREAQTTGDNKPEATPLAEIVRDLKDDKHGLSGQLRTELDTAKQNRELKMETMLKRYPEAGIYLADSASELPPDAVQAIIVDVVNKAVEMGDAAERARRAESFLQAFPDVVQDRARAKAVESPTVVNAQAERTQQGIF
jgi:hypothetical protein